MKFDAKTILMVAVVVLLVLVALKQVFPKIPGLNMLAGLAG